MDEVDKIIIHSLKEIGCKVENDDDCEIFGLKHFTPDLLVRSVSKCLQEINHDVVVPKSLPENMAQRFTVATVLAEMCSSCGYRGDIGYQTFLYPNEVDIRRLFMFLIEQLPKEHIKSLENSLLEDKHEFDILVQDVRKKIKQQLKSPWVPQYCRGIGNRKTLGCCSLSVDFIPQLNLTIPKSAKSIQEKEHQLVVTYQIPSIFQQTSIRDYDLISSVLHQNAIDIYASSPQSIESERLFLAGALQPILSPFTSPENSSEIEEFPQISAKTPIRNITNEIEFLKIQNHHISKDFQAANIKLSQLRQQRTEIENQIEDMKKTYKVLERTSVILENPEENINKLEHLIEKTRERRLVMESQWQLHRNPALQRIVDLKKLKQSKNQQSIHELKSTIDQLQKVLVEKNHSYLILEDELKKATNDGASRKEYTRRIYEFIGNIRKQRNDIYKILDDTKDLQKQLNSVSAQLQRQFNYTDDLLFQSAKHDLHAKQAYKLLVSLHASCDEICDLVSRTGQLTKESRDLEVQIDRERMRNVAASLEKITLDIRKFETIIKTMKSDINEVENEIQAC